MLTVVHGEQVAIIIGDLHEQGSRDIRDSEVDQHNNKLGRELGKRLFSGQDCKKMDRDALEYAVEQAVKWEMTTSRPRYYAPE